MVKIPIAELKSRQTTAQSLLEKNLEIDRHDLESTVSRVDALLLELENIREALIYKQEQIKAENTQFTEFSFKEFEIRHKFQRDDYCDFNDVVDKQNEVSQLNLIEKYIKMKQEIEMGGSVEEIVDRVFSNIEDELEFWCFFLDEYRPSETHYDAKKKTEEKLLDLFERSFDDPAKCALIYRSSFYLNQGYPLIKMFINRIELLKNPFFCDPPFKKVVNFDSDDADAKFVEFLQKVKSVYEVDLSNLNLIFFDPTKIAEQVGKRLFDDLLTTNLDRLLRDTDPANFLQVLSSCYAHTKKTCFEICEIFPIFFDSVDIENVFVSFFAVVPAKEKAAFDSFFDLLVFKKPLRHEVVFLAEKLAYEPDKDKVFAKLIKMTERIFVRSKQFNLCVVADYFLHYFRRFNDFIDNVEDKFIGNEKFELMAKIGEYYVILNDFARSNEIGGFDVFSQHVESRLNLLFEYRVKSAQVEIKSIFGKMKNTEYSAESVTQTMKDLIAYLYNEVALCNKHIFGQNAQRYVRLILESVYICIRKKIQSYKFNIKEANTLFNDAIYLLDFVKKNSVQSVATFEYLLELIELISVSKEDVNLFVSNIYEKIPDIEIKDALKSRCDYKEIKDVFNKLKF